MNPIRGLYLRTAALSRPSLRPTCPSSLFDTTVNRLHDGALFNPCALRAQLPGREAAAGDRGVPDGESQFTERESRLVPKRALTGRSLCTPYCAPQVSTSSMIGAADSAQEGAAGWGSTKIGEVLATKVRRWRPVFAPRGFRRASHRGPVRCEPARWCRCRSVPYLKESRGCGSAPVIRGGLAVLRRAFALIWAVPYLSPQGADNGAWLWCSRDDLVIDAVRKVSLSYRSRTVASPPRCWSGAVPWAA